MLNQNVADKYKIKESNETYFQKNGKCYKHAPAWKTGHALQTPPMLARVCNACLNVYY